MAIDLKSGTEVTTDSILEAHRDVANPLNGEVTKKDLSRAVLGPDQLYSGALRSSIQKEVTRGTIVDKHVTYPETYPHSDFRHTIRWHTSSSGYTPTNIEVDGVSHAYHRHRSSSSWQSIWPYESTGGYPGTTYDGFPYSFRMYDLKSGSEGCTVFFYLNARISTYYEHKPKYNGVLSPPYLAGPAKAGDRGWLAPIFFFKMNPDAPLLSFSPMTSTGGFALEFNGEWQKSRRFNDVEQVFSTTEPFFLTRKSMQQLAYFNGYYPYSTFNMGSSDPWKPLFGWKFMGGRDAWNFQWDTSKPGGVDAAIATGVRRSGDPFKVANGNVGFMTFDYVEKDDSKANDWFWTGWRW